MSISFVGISLDNQSKSKLLSLVIPPGWVAKADHMTINLGSAEESPVRNRIGEHVSLIANKIARDDRVIAVGVDTDVPSKNPVKHITLAVNVVNGGKPMMSNELQNWQAIPPIQLRGTIQEFEFSNGKNQPVAPQITQKRLRSSETTP